MFLFVVVLNHQAQIEANDDAISAVMLSCGRSPMIYVAKCFTTTVILFAAQCLTAGLVALFFPVGSAAGPLDFAVVFFVASFGVAALGTLLSCISVASDSRELLLPIILFPMLLTITGAATTLCRELLFRGGFEAQSFPFIFLCAFGVVVFTLGVALFDTVTES